MERPELIRQLITRWRDDAGATYKSWFLWEERIKNFRSIRRGIEQVIAEIEAGTFGVTYRGSSLETIVHSIDDRIPSGILVANMTGVRLSFRKFGVMSVRCISPDARTIKTSVLGCFCSSKIVVPLAGLELTHLSIPHFELLLSVADLSLAFIWNPRTAAL